MTFFRRFVLAAILTLPVVAFWHAPARGAACFNDPNCNPMCGGTIIITSGSLVDTILPGANCSWGNRSIHLLGSSSGLAHEGGNGVHIRLLDSEGYDLDSNTHGISIGSAQEFWLTGVTFSNGNLDTPLLCLDPDVPSSLEQPYLQKLTAPGGVTFHPTFGGSGNLLIQIKMGGGQYGPLAMVFQGRSTDVDADGDTDEADEAAMRAAIGGSNMAYDLDWSGVVDSADLAILLNEAKRHATGGLCSDITNSDPVMGIPGDYDPIRNVQYPPATTSDLAVTRVDASTVRLSWTAPADDGSSGRPATAYDVRRSASPITSIAAFNAATPVTSAPGPGNPGGTETMDVTLAAGTSQYFAIRTKDDVDNWSGVSNSPQIADTPPAAISDLLGAAGRYMVRLNWTAPGEDGSFGTAAAYDVRYVTGATISESNWASATVVTQVPTPTVAGSAVCMLVTDLADCTAYSFAVKTRDAAGQWSAISNARNLTTRCSGTLSYDCGGTMASPARDEARDVPLALGGISPNPTRAGGQILYSIPAEQRGEPLELAVYDVSGRLRAVLASGAAAPGTFATRWDLAADGGGRIRPGIYFLRLRVGERTLSRPLTVTP